MISCPLCFKNFAKRASLASHTKCHTKEKPHKCLTCSATFARAHGLRMHVACVHNGHKENRKKNSHYCPLCSYKCYQHSKLQIHLRKHSDHFPFSCNVASCEFKTKYEYSLKLHARSSHSSESPYECPSDGCSYKSKRQGDLTRHLKIHSSEKPFKCKVPGCDYTCKMKSYLRGHTSRAHSDEKPFKCTFCDFCTKLRPSLIQHERRHTKVKQFQCQVPNCGFASLTKRTVQLHIDAKHRKKVLRCTAPRCAFRCGSIALLKTHVKRHENPIFKCPHDSCNFNTRFKWSLLGHITHRHGDAQPRVSDIETIGRAGAMKILRCHFRNCSYQTEFQNHYDRHIITHSKEKKREHVCTFCFCRFGYPRDLRIHLRKHTGEKPYNCSFCNYAAVCSTKLKQHAMLIHHIHVTHCGKGDQVRMCRTCNKTCWSYSEFLVHSMSHLKPVVMLERLRVQTF